MKDAPISWRERDLLTAAEKFMGGMIEFPLIEFTRPCYLNLDAQITPTIAQVWRCTTACIHLNMSARMDDSNSSLKQKTARIYEMEYQRLLGSLFPLQHEFWKTFYIRQEEELNKVLIALDALYFATKKQGPINYQLLAQSISALTKAYYRKDQSKKENLNKAHRLIIDLPLPDLKTWMIQQLNSIN